MRIVSVKQGRDFNYDTTRLFLFETSEETSKEPIYVLRAVENLSGADIQVAKSFNRVEVEGKMREILDSYERDQKVFYVD